MIKRKRLIGRRGFLRSTAAALGAVATPQVIPASALGAGGVAPPSERVTMGWVGVGGQSGGHLFGTHWTYLPGGYLARPDVQVLGVCDVIEDRRHDAARRVNQHYAARYGNGNYRSCTAYFDFVEMFARDDIDAVLLGTAAHWHALMSIMAAEAGKDVFVEKPTALTLAESRAVVRAVARYGRVFQAGTQQRSEYGGVFRRACELVRSGRIGKLETVYANHQGGMFRAIRYDGSPPATIDPAWDRWLGPAPYFPGGVPMDPHRLGFGGINWGQHYFDIVDWGIGPERAGPVEVGPRHFQYADGVVVHAENSPYAFDKSVGPGGPCFVGSDGKIAVGRNGISADPPELLDEPLGANDVRLYYSTSHSGNFLDCVKTRKQPICDAESTHRSASLMLLGGVAMELNRTLQWDPIQEEFIDDHEANRLRSYATREPWRI